MSDARFSKAFVAPTKCLRTIDDVLDELTCIKRVFQDQLQVWKKVHSGDKSCVVCNEFMNNQGAKGDRTTKDDVETRGDMEKKIDLKIEGDETRGHGEAEGGKEQNEGEPKREVRQGRDTCPSNILPERSLELTMRLEEDALKVRESASSCLVERPDRMGSALTMDRL